MFVCSVRVVLLLLQAHHRVPGWPSALWRLALAQRRLCQCQGPPVSKEQCVEIKLEWTDPKLAPPFPPDTERHCYVQSWNRRYSAQAWAYMEGKKPEGRPLCSIRHGSTLTRRVRNVILLQQVTLQSKPDVQANWFRALMDRMLYQDDFDANMWELLVWCGIDTTRCIFFHTLKLGLSVSFIYRCNYYVLFFYVGWFVSLCDRFSCEDDWKEKPMMFYVFKMLTFSCFLYKCIKQNPDSAYTDTPCMCSVFLSVNTSNVNP